MEEKLKEKNSI